MDKINIGFLINFIMKPKNINSKRCKMQKKKIAKEENKK